MHSLDLTQPPLTSTVSRPQSVHDIALDRQPHAPLVVVNRLLDTTTRQQSLRDDLLTGFTSTPKSIPTKWLYNDEGGKLFGAITRTDDYYLGRSEHEIIERSANDIVRIANATQFVDLGAGICDRTLTILSAMQRANGEANYVPFDIDEHSLQRTAEGIARRLPDVTVHAILGDFAQHLHAIPLAKRSLISLLGHTWGNFSLEERIAFLDGIKSATQPGDLLMLGVDLVKDAQRLERAYDDSEGATAEFTMNVLKSINKGFGANFDLSAFRHRATWSLERSRVEIDLVSQRSQTVHVPELNIDASFMKGEAMRVGISEKFTVSSLVHELRRSGLNPLEIYADSTNDYVVVIARR